MTPEMLNGIIGVASLLIGILLRHKFPNIFPAGPTPTPSPLPIPAPSPDGITHHPLADTLLMLLNLPPEQRALLQGLLDKLPPGPLSPK